MEENPTTNREAGESVLVTKRQISGEPDQERLHPSSPPSPRCGAELARLADETLSGEAREETDPNTPEKENPSCTPKGKSNWRPGLAKLAGLTEEIISVMAREETAPNKTDECDLTNQKQLGQRRPGSAKLAKLVEKIVQKHPTPTQDQYEEFSSLLQAPDSPYRIKPSACTGELGLDTDSSMPKLPSNESALATKRATSRGPKDTSRTCRPLPAWLDGSARNTRPEELNQECTRPSRPPKLLSNESSSPSEESSSSSSESSFNICESSLNINELSHSSGVERKRTYVKTGKKKAPDEFEESVLMTQNRPAKGRPRPTETPPSPQTAKDTAEETIKMPEKISSTNGEETRRKSNNPDARADIRQRARKAATNKLAKNRLAKSLQLIKNRDEKIVKVLEKEPKNWRPGLAERTKLTKEIAQERPHLGRPAPPWPPSGKTTEPSQQVDPVETREPPAVVPPTSRPMVQD